MHHGMRAETSEFGREDRIPDASGRLAVGWPPFHFDDHDRLDRRVRSWRVRGHLLHAARLLRTLDIEEQHRGVHPPAGGRGHGTVGPSPVGAHPDVESMPVEDLLTEGECTTSPGVIRSHDLGLASRFAAPIGRTPTNWWTRMSGNSIPDDDDDSTDRVTVGECRRTDGRDSPVWDLIPKNGNGVQDAVSGSGGCHSLHPTQWRGCFTEPSARNTGFPASTSPCHGAAVRPTRSIPGASIQTLRSPDVSVDTHR